MVLLIIVILVVAAAVGALGFILRVAVGVALGLILAVLAIGALIVWRVRRAFRSALGPPRPQQRWKQVPGSTVEVLDRDDPRSKP